jgi:hypothetical protein
MAIYYRKRPRAERPEPAAELPPTPLDGDGERMTALSSEYDRYRESLLETDEGEGWSSELRHYLNDRPLDVTKTTDIVRWWQVSRL